MARTSKYIVAANGTYHFFNGEKQASACGRVRPNLDGVKQTNVLPKNGGNTTCGRCAQLSGLSWTEGAAEASTATVKKTSGGRKATHSDGSSVELVTTPDPAPTKRRGRKAAVTASEGPETVSVSVPDVRVIDTDDETQQGYARITELMDANGIKVTENAGPDGLSLFFQAGDWIYQVWSRQFSTAEGEWTLTYTLADGSLEPSYAEGKDGPFTDVEQVIGWLVNDLELQPVKPKAVKRTAKPSSNGAKPINKVATVNVNAHGPLLSAAFTSLIASRDIAQQLGGMDKATADLMAQTIQAVTELRNALAPLN